MPKDAEYNTITDSGIQHDLVDTVYEILKKTVSDVYFSIWSVLTLLINIRYSGASIHYRITFS